jgi:hypothetical protein
MRLIPGVAVFPAVFASIDINGDGVISEAEQLSYAGRVLREVLLAIDGKRLEPTLVSVRFPELGQLKEGLGEIQIEFIAELPQGAAERTIVLENHHQNAISAYLVNCLVPLDPDIRVLRQNRNESQSFYQLKYLQTGDSSRFAFLRWWSTFRASHGTLPPRGYPQWRVHTLDVVGCSRNGKATGLVPSTVTEVPLAWNIAIRSNMVG